MKSPADYLEAPVFYLTYPTGEDADSVPVVTYTDALRAIETALADAEEYKYLLVRALRLRQAPATAPDTPVRPLYHQEEEAQPQAA